MVVVLLADALTVLGAAAALAALDELLEELVEVLDAEDELDEVFVSASVLVFACSCSWAFRFLRSATLKATPSATS